MYSPTHRMVRHGFHCTSIGRRQPPHSDRARPRVLRTGTANRRSGGAISVGGGRSSHPSRLTESTRPHRERRVVSTPADARQPVSSASLTVAVHAKFRGRTRLFRAARGGTSMSIGRFSTFVIVVAIGALSACARLQQAAGPPAQPPAGPTAQEAAANRLKPYKDGLEALQTYQANGECATAAAAKIEAMIDKLKAQTTTFHRLSTLASYEREARERHTALAFSYADAALHKNCLDQADRVYRDLIHFYVGGAYGGIRDRARVGIDDVRARRQ